MAQTAVPHVHGGVVNRWRGRSRDLDKSTRLRNRFRAVTSSPAAGSTPGRENGRILYCARAADRVDAGAALGAAPTFRISRAGRLTPPPEQPGRTGNGHRNAAVDACEVLGIWRPVVVVWPAGHGLQCPLIELVA
jgi:hypothetical protein